MSIDIDYSGTEKLVTEPLKYCEKPKVLYDLRKLTLYATRNDIARIIHFLASSCKCSFIGWLRVNDEWVKRDLTANEAEETVLQDNGPLRMDPYLRIYALRDHLEIHDAHVKTIRDEDSFWKRHEIVRLSCPSHIGMGTARALLFYIDFANEFIDGQRIVQKSGSFVTMTTSLLNWLEAKFVNWRGPRCFDNPDENIRIFGDRFRNGG